MNGKQVYLITTPNLEEIEAVAIRKVAARSLFDTWLMYSQNRLFTIHENKNIDGEHYQYGIIVCNYCIIPEADSILKSYMEGIKEYSYYVTKLNII